ncbi:Crp/Fnr family transcriptional regulator FnrL [soil metagenome]|jgi:CRP/FNR family transcriptional regulator|uniref:Crp/Fnr family transcriptional regulator n=1 Tax=unclassified Sphingobium TaxID=2611147 RepID=UPI001E2B0D42|nr:MULTISPECIES: Crp/Fnr family transcriptional regulator [unclassified Sphingobium]GLI98138.1 transcriptional activator protein FnrL [Sphingobium sp. BS19]CAH0348598.1 Nitrogen fixation regulation protein FixK [Sphingobium sp. CECT 9361]
MSACNSCVVRTQAMCSILSDREREEFARLGRQMAVPTGQTLMWEGADSMVVANVVSGALKLSTSVQDGREQIVGVVYPSDFIGRPFGKTSPHSVTALSDARLCVFPRGAFDMFARSHPDLEHRLLRRTLDELDRARGWMLLLGRASAREKVATFIRDVAGRLAAEGDAPLTRFDLPLSRQQIADILGLTIETVCRQLTAMKRAGVIDLIGRRGVAILNPDQLEDMAHAA